ncbi:MAG: PEP-CTERM system TPR-repeat protein PrsT [Gammaproteobacteria bacterium]|nr:PEP-CTERM system TPR-repeat protein PrsT [Gammaproteobacteria bacterium]
MKASYRNCIRTILICLLFVLSSCGDNKPEIKVQDHLDLAQLYLKQGSFKASIIEGKNALQLEPDNTEALTLMSTVLLKLNEGSTANSLINKAIDLDKENENLKLLLTKALILQGKRFSAQSTLDNINPEGINDKSEYEKLNADLLLISGKHNEAKRWYMKAIKSNSDNVDAIIGAARTSLILQQIDDTNKYTTLAIETAPTNINAMLWQARVFMVQKRYVDAENILSRSMIELERYDILTADKYSAINMLAKALVAQGKIEESFTYSNYLAKSRPGLIQASVKEAFSLISNHGDLNAAEKAFQDILKQAPKHKSSGIMLGLINYEKGDYTQAEDYLSEFANDENSPLRSKKTLALTKIKLNKIDDAIEIINEVMLHTKDDADLHALLGFAYLASKDATRSIIELKKAIKLNRNNSLYHTHLARAHLLNNDTVNALKSATTALKIKPNSKYAKLAMVSSYTIKKDFKNARDFVNKWLNQSPNDITPLNVSTSIELETNNYEKAKIQLLKSLAIAPYDLFSNLNIIRFDIQDNKIDKAFERLSLVLGKHPENLKALSLLFKLSINSKKADQATKVLETINDKHPSSINPRIILAQLYLSTKQPDKSLFIIDDITKLDNKNTHAYFLKAKALLAKNDIKQAVATYLLLASLAPKDPEAYSHLGHLYLAKKDLNKAIDYTTRALSIQNDYIPAQILMAKISISKNDSATALKSIDLLKHLTPDSHFPHELEADLYLQAKDYIDALASLQQAWNKSKNITLANKILLTSKLSNKNDTALFAWDELALENKDDLKIQMSYSLALQNENLIKKAQTVLESQLIKFPNNAIILNNLANCYLENDDKRALETAKLALLNLPDSPAIQDTLGLIYTEQHKNYEKGIPLLKHAYSSTSSDIIKQHLIKALADSGNMLEANQLRSQ